MLTSGRVALLAAPTSGTVTVTLTNVTRTRSAIALMPFAEDPPVVTLLPVTRTRGAVKIGANLGGAGEGNVRAIVRERYLSVENFASLY